MTKDEKSQILPEGYEFNLSDFALFLAVMKNREAYESTLSLILEEPKLKLAEVKVEQVVLNKSGKRGRRLNIGIYPLQILFLLRRRIFLERIWQNIHLRSSVKRFPDFTWKMGQGKYF